MRFDVHKWIFSKSDHLWISESNTGDYTQKRNCLSCGFALTPITKITNKFDEIGLVMGICEKCGFVTQMNQLKASTIDMHFSRSWHAQRQATDVVENDYPFKVLEKWLKPGSEVLDVGCGKGDRLMKFYKMGYLVNGVEPSERQASIANKKLPNITNGFAEKYLESTTRNFDLIYFFNVLQFVSNPFDVLELASSRLNPGGLMFLRVGGLNATNLFLLSHQALMRNYFSVESLVRYFGSMNFEIIYSHQGSSFDILVRIIDDKNLTRKYVVKPRQDSSYIMRQMIGKAMPWWKRFFDSNQVYSLGFPGRYIEGKVVKGRDPLLPVEMKYQGHSLPVVYK